MCLFYNERMVETGFQHHGQLYKRCHSKPAARESFIKFYVYVTPYIACLLLLKLHYKEKTYCLIFNLGKYVFGA